MKYSYTSCSVNVEAQSYNQLKDRKVNLKLSVVHQQVQKGNNKATIVRKTGKPIRQKHIMRRPEKHTVDVLVRISNQVQILLI